MQDIKDLLYEIGFFAVIMIISKIFKQFSPMYVFIFLNLLDNSISMDRDYESIYDKASKFLFFYNSNLTFFKRFIYSKFYYHTFKYSIFIIITALFGIKYFIPSLIYIVSIFLLNIFYSYLNEKTFKKIKKTDNFIVQYIVIMIISSITVGVYLMSRR